MWDKYALFILFSAEYGWVKGLPFPIQALAERVNDEWNPQFTGQ